MSDMQEENSAPKSIFSDEMVKEMKAYRQEFEAYEAKHARRRKVIFYLRAITWTLAAIYCMIRSVQIVYGSNMKADDQWFLYSVLIMGVVVAWFVVITSKD